MNPDTRMIDVHFEDGTMTACSVGTPVMELATSDRSPSGFHYLGALVNNDAVSLTYPLDVDCTVRFVDLTDHHGWRIYRRSLSYLLAKTVKELYPEARFRIEHSLGTGFYCDFEMNGERGVSDDRLARIDARLRELIDANQPIERSKIPYTDAVRHFENAGQIDKFNLLRFRNPPKVVVYRCGDFFDLAYGPLAQRTGDLPYFALTAHPPGFVIRFPDRDRPPGLPPFEPQPHLFNIFKEHKEWGRILGVNTVGRLNEIVAAREGASFARIAEALHEKKIAHIAEHIQAHSRKLKWVLIAGPSSSGKTTFAKRLAVQLRVCGIQPVTLSVDDYFVDREKSPRTPSGDYDFENIETIDLALLNEHLQRLDEGEEVELPSFHFEKGMREYRGKTLRLGADETAIVEGIHALNPRLTEVLPAAHKFGVYVSALTQLNLDDNNRISTTDNRLVRRLVRDHQFRGNSALTTLRMWRNVRAGEKQWVFPYQQYADIAFNSALDYELGVLRHFAEPLLSEVKPSDPEYAEARRLQEFLSFFLSISASVVPPTSILREFIGRSSFHY